MAPKTIYGQITHNGDIVSGTGFQCSRIAQGIYSIDFTNDFSTIPSVTETAIEPTTVPNQVRYLAVNVPNNGQATVYSYRKWSNSDTTPSDVVFNFIAVGEE